MGTSIGWPFFQPWAMSKVRRPLTMAPQSFVHPSMIALLASGGASHSFWRTDSGPAM